MSSRDRQTETGRAKRCQTLPIHDRLAGLNEPFRDTP